MTTPGEKIVGTVLMVVFVSVLLAQLIAYVQDWFKDREKGDK